MRSAKRIFLVGLLMALALGFTQGLAGSTPTAAAATVVGCGTTSSADGEQMILSSNLSCAGTAVTITHNKVHLDMQGWTLDGDGTGIGIHIKNSLIIGNCGGTAGGPSRVHINGGTVKEFDHGIFLCRSDTAHINGMTLTLNDLAGILISRASTGGNSGPSNHRINGSTLSFNGCAGGCQPGEVLEGGLVVVSASGNVIHTMNIHNNNRFGVHFRTAGGNRITSSQVIDNVGTGIFSDRAGGNTIQGNNIEGNAAGVGVVAGGGGETIRGNTINNNNSGISILFSPNALVRGNTVTNGAFGITLDRNTGSLLQSNTALNNSNVDLADNNNNSLGACVNTWKSNTFVTKTDPAGCIQ